MNLQIHPCNGGDILVLGHQRHSHGIHSGRVCGRRTATARGGSREAWRTVPSRRGGRAQVTNAVKLAVSRAASALGALYSLEELTAYSIEDVRMDRVQRVLVTE
jgi:hypothetical protein